MRTRLVSEPNPARRIVLIRDIALFAVSFDTRRRDDLHHTLGSGVLKLPYSAGFILYSGNAQAVPIVLKRCSRRFSL